MSTVAAALGQEDELHELASISATSGNPTQSIGGRGTNSMDTARTSDVFFDIDDEQLLLNQPSSQGSPSTRQPLFAAPNQAGIGTGSLKKRKGKMWQLSSRCKFCLSSCLIVGFAIAVVAYFYRAVLNEELELLKKQLKRPKNIILMLADGYGPASESLARTYYHSVYPKSPFYLSTVKDDGSSTDEYATFALPLDKLLTGSIRTKSSSSLVTDSAAGATAYSCALKSYNGAIAVTPENKTACLTVLEAAHNEGYRTAMVVTSRITHATPAAFSAHVTYRNLESDIAVQQVLGFQGNGRKVDLVFGGGRCFFEPSSVNASDPAHSIKNPHSCRKDNRNLLDEAIKANWTILRTRKEFEDLGESFEYPIAGLFTGDHMAYEIDRNATSEPSLAEMTYKALKTLMRKPSEKGFFMLVEGSRIDMAGHSNDPASHLQDIFAYQDAVQVALSFAESHPDTIVISVSDHETGGMSVGRQVGEKYPQYRWRPERLKNVEYSTEHATFSIASELLNIDSQMNNTALDKRKLQAIANVLLQELALTTNPDEDFHVSQDDLRTILKLVTKAFDFRSSSEIDLGYNPSVHAAAFLPVQYYLSELESKNAEVGWTTHGHTGVDINLYVYGLEKNQGFKELDQDIWPLLNETFAESPTTTKPFKISWDVGEKKGHVKIPDLNLFPKKQLKGNLENIDVGKWMAEFLGVDLMKGLANQVQEVRLRKRWLKSRARE